MKKSGEAFASRRHFIWERFKKKEQLRHETLFYRFRPGCSPEISAGLNLRRHEPARSRCADGSTQFLARFGGVRFGRRVGEAIQGRPRQSWKLKARLKPRA